MNSSPSAAFLVRPRATETLCLQPVSLDAVSIRDGWWGRWQSDNRSITTPHAFFWLENDGTIDNLRRLDPAAQDAPERRGLWFTDSDLYKALEGVAWDLARGDDPELAALVEDIARILGHAQQDDGYLNSYTQAGFDVRWDNLVHTHELYCMGHLIQAGIAHRRATGSTSLFDVAVKAADVIVRDFGDGRRTDTDGHEEIEMAMVELYRETGERSYLDLAGQLLDVRGHRVLDPVPPFDSDYYQDAVPVREQTTVVGHAVRAVYLLAGMVDVYIETGERALLDAAIAQWESMVDTKLYINGSLGSRFVGEAFGDSFELPPDLVYGETCASIGLVMASWRLLLVTGQSRFADVIERCLYNTISASTALDRRGFFYNNPAQRRRALPAASTTGRPDRADAPGTRPIWFECACCPPNIMRTIASLGGYVATSSLTTSTRTSAIQLHQYLGAHLEIPLAAGVVQLEMHTRYPDDGVIRVRVVVTPADRWALELRVPHWAATADVRCNGTATSPTQRDGYLVLERQWVEGDEIELTLPMDVRLSAAHPSADALRGTVAIERGPVVYVLESVDQDSGVDLNHVELAADPQPTIDEGDVAGQRTPVIHLTGFARDDSAWVGSPWQDSTALPARAGRAVELTAIPYALWANRGPSVMRTFVPVARG